MTGHQQPINLTKNPHERLDLDFAMQAAGLGVWELDPGTNLVTWDDRCRQLFGLAPDSQLSYEQATQYIHPDDRDRVNLAVQQALDPQGKGIYDITYRTLGADDGQLRWVRFIGRAYFDPAGALYRFGGVAQDLTPQVMDQQLQQQASEARFRSLIEEAPVSTCLFMGSDLVIESINDIMLGYWGRDKSVIGKPLIEALPELEGQPHLQILREVYATGKPHEARGVRADLQKDGEIQTYYFDLIHKPLRDANGRVYAIMDMSMDVTEQVLAHQKLAESENRFRTMAEGSGMLIAVSDENGQWTYLSQAWADLTGRSVEDLMNLGWVDLVHPDDRAAFLMLYQSAFSQQKSFSGEFRILNRDGVYRWLLVNCPARFQRGLDGSDDLFTGYISSALDITDRKQAEEALRASEARLRSVIATAPAGMAVFMGRDLLIELPNRTFIDIVGKGPDIVGKPLREVMPELISEHQPFLQILDDVYTSGQMYQSYGSKVSIVQQGIMTHNYYNISFTPLRDETDQLYAILVIALDVTEQIKAQQALTESEAHLELLRDTVPAMIFYLDAEQRYRSYNGVFKEWFGVTGKEAIGKTVLEFLGEAAYQRAKSHLDKAYAGQQERYEMYAPSRMNTDRWLDIVYTPHKSASGELLGVIVHATDISPSKQAEISLRNSESRYRALSADLEQQVQQRTRELAAANEELAALNVELRNSNQELLTSNQATIAANESLSESNHNLTRSNDNLEKFAYIASHDLQEPLRKIQQFGDLLKTQYADALGEGTVYLERMQSAASRMSRLIKDLLTFSRISTRQDAITSVPLQDVIDSALSDLEVRLEETGALVHVDALPVVVGDRSQLEQLFQNLLSNALKFQLNEVKPVISVRYQLVSASELLPSVKPTRKASQYHCVQVSDNGIGFNEKYADRIFQVFQRLHGKNDYAGTGIGLAICEKVVANHGGAIVATSQPGQGATFTVYLPAFAADVA
jgi:PAS domain S-box-containing protein